MTLVERQPTAGTPSLLPALSVRAATIEDREFAMSLASRLAASSPVPWRDPRKLLAAYVSTIDGILESIPGYGEMLIAEDRRRLPRGCVLLLSFARGHARDCGRRVAQLALAGSNLERSVGAALALHRTVEAWARNVGYRLLLLGESWSSPSTSAQYVPDRIDAFTSRLDRLR